MAIVFWKPCAQNDTKAAMDDIFSNIDEQDGQVGRLPIKPFFDKTPSNEEKTVFVSDMPNALEDPKRFLQELNSSIQHFSDKLNSSTWKLFLSVRNRRWLPLIASLFPDAETTFTTTYSMIKPPPPPPIKASFSSALPLSMGNRGNPSISSLQTSYHTSILHGKTWWPSIFSEANRIIPINLFSSSHLFAIHSNISSFFYSMPSASQSFITIHSDLKKRSQMLGEFISPLQDKISHSALIGWHKEASFVLVSNDVLAGDSFSSALGGLRALQIPLNKYAHQRNWGTGDIVKINLLGPKFLKPLFDLSCSSRLDKKHRLEVDPARCIHCEVCVSACPGSAWKKTQKMYDWIKPQCNQCGHCIDFCPVNAINII